MGQPIMIMNNFNVTSYLLIAQGNAIVTIDLDKGRNLYHLVVTNGIITSMLEIPVAVFIELRKLSGNNVTQY